MYQVKTELLTLEAFAPYGSFANLINPQDEKIGAPPVEFFRDQLQMGITGQPMLSYSCCRVEKRPMVIDTLEYHSVCSEALLPLDGDILLQVTAATSSSKELDPEKVRIFYVPQGTVVVIKPGVWHWAPFSLEEKAVNILINLPERTYANDCFVINLPERQRIEIEL